jgi:hypothetical protein
MVHGFAKWVAAGSKAAKGTNIVKAAVLSATGAAVAFGAKAAGGVLRFIKPLTIAAAKFILVTLIIDDLITFLEGGESAFGDLIDAILGAGNAEGAVKRLGDIAKKALAGDFGGAVDSLVDGLDAMGKAIVDSFSDGGAAAEFFSEQGETIVIGFITIWEAAAQAFDEAMIFIGGSIVAAGEGISEGVSDMVSALGDAVSDFWDAAVELGTAIWEGIVQALEDGVDAVVDAAKGLAKGALDAAASIIRPGSPSRAFYDLFVTAPQGGVKALEEGQRDVAVAGARLAGVSIVGAQIRQQNTVSIPVSGAGSPDQVAGRVATGFRSASREGLDAALAALVATA